MGSPHPARPSSFLRAMPSSQDRTGAPVGQDSRELLLKGQPQWLAGGGREAAQTRDAGK